MKILIIISGLALTLLSVAGLYIYRDNSRLTGILQTVLAAGFILLASGILAGLAG